jgi:hypothetical protein
VGVDAAFYYEVLRLPDGQAFRLKVRPMVGLLPLCASTVFEGDLLERHLSGPDQPLHLLRRRLPGRVPQKSRAKSEATDLA